MSIEVKPQPISGVSAGSESLLETSCPSIASSPIGRLLGQICDSIPLRIGGVKLSHLLFALPLAPFALIGYAVVRGTGNRYEVTNRSVRIRKLVGGTLLRQVALTDFADVAIEVLPGQEFYHAGDLHLVDGKGADVLVLPGVSRPERLRQVILKARTARIQSDASLKTIQARK